MPQIFDEAGRERVRILLLENGFDLIKTHGLKKTSISDITRRAGIASGTFYNFFKTKEEFVYQIVLYKRAQSKELLTKMSEGKKMDADTFRKYLTTLYTSDNNIFEYLNESEIDQLKARWPEEYWRTAITTKVPLNKCWLCWIIPETTATGSCSEISLNHWLLSAMVKISYIRTNTRRRSDYSQI